jgi:hypothetical protein
MVSEMMAQSPDVGDFIPGAGVVLCHLTLNVIGCSPRFFRWLSYPAAMVFFMCAILGVELKLESRCLRNRRIMY